jgi:hypothetical protein
MQTAHERALAQMAVSRQLRALPRGRGWAMTSSTCSAYPDTQQTPVHLRWWDPGTNRCVLGDESSVAWCQQQGTGVEWSPDPTSGVAHCYLTEDYCVSKGQVMIDGDCTVDFQTFFLEQMVGQTISRGLSWVMLNPEKAVEGVVALYMTNVHKVPGVEELDRAADRIGLLPYTRGAQALIARGVNGLWASPVGKTAFRGLGLAMREYKRAMAVATPYMQKGLDASLDFVTDYGTLAVNRFADNVRDGVCRADSPGFVAGCYVYAGRRMAAYAQRGAEVVSSWGSEAAEQSKQRIMYGIDRAAELAVTPALAAMNAATETAEATEDLSRDFANQVSGALENVGAEIAEELENAYNATLGRLF